LTRKAVYLTPDGEKKIRAELEELKGPKREALAQRLRHAIQMGDLSENADYIMAKEEQAFLEGRIQELEMTLREVIIIEEKRGGDRVEIGTIVVVQEGDSDPETYRLVGVKEADPRAGKISYESPIGKALLGARVGDTVEAATPGGSISFKILEVQ
jgi:transcription elongation factor GreA